MNYDHLLSRRTANMDASAIREILKVVAQPDMVSLAGGLPSPDTFPIDVIRTLADRVLTKYQTKALQYDATEGFTPLREVLAAYLGGQGLQAEVDTITIYGGSQNLLDTVAKILISPGDVIALEAPTYLGALTAFNPYEPRYIGVPMDEYGILPDALEKVLQTEPVKFIYLVPTFQNPTGRCLPVERRKQVAALAQQYNTLIVEDDPYSALRYDGERVPTVQQFAPDNVIYTSTFSKIFAPGLRIGFAVAPPTISRWLTVAKQGSDLHTSTFNQAMAAEYLLGEHLEEQLPKIVGLYHPRRDAMLQAMEETFPKDFWWSKPEGGMFVWAGGPADVDAEKIYWQAVENKVAFVPGKFFYADNPDISTMRLNFTSAQPDVIRAAVERLAAVIKAAR